MSTPSPLDPFAAWKKLAVSASVPGGPGAAFVSQLEATLSAIHERRAQVQALTAQLALFDDQLAVFEATVQPVLEWSRAWVRLQETAMDPFGLTKRRDDPKTGRP